MRRACMLARDALADAGSRRWPNCSATAERVRDVVAVRAGGIDAPAHEAHFSTTTIFPSLIVSRQPFCVFSNFFGWCAATSSTARFTASSGPRLPGGDGGASTGVISSGKPLVSVGPATTRPSYPRRDLLLVPASHTASAGTRNFSFTRIVLGGSTETSSTSATHGCLANAAVSFGARSGSRDWNGIGELRMVAHFDQKRLARGIPAGHRIRCR